MQKLQNVAEALRKNNIEATVVKSRADIMPLLKTLIPAGVVVGCGGSVTLAECGAAEAFKPERLHECDIYLCSANAVTEAGELYNVDGFANRVSAIANGPKKVIVIAGKNKIVKNIIGAVERVKTVAAPKNTKRLGRKTPCAISGRCISIDQKRPFATDGCDSPERICCHYLITGFQSDKNRITVILVNEDLGY